MRVFRSMTLAAGVALAILTAALLQAETTTAKQRSDIDDKYKWDLSEIFSSDADWSKGMDEFKSHIPLMEQFKG